MRKKICPAAFAFLLFAQLTSFAQLTTPNDSGVGIGHIHLLSKVPEAQ
jgi:hypothetical protein